MNEGTKEEKLDRARAWTYIMPDIDFEQAKTAVIKILRTSKFEPKPSEIIEAVKSMTDNTPSAEQAWQEVIDKLNPYKKPEWSSDLIQEAVKVMGYKQLCGSENPSIDRAQFMKIYNNLRDRRGSEQENAAVIGMLGSKLKLLG